MKETEFRQRLEREGYEGPFDYQRGADFVDKEHVHDFDVLAMVVEGSMTIKKSSGDVTCQVGDTFSFAAGERHLEVPGASGVSALIGRRSNRA